MAGMLFLVPTPIGNLGDISLRATEVLRAADFVAAEDTRVSLRLLNHLGIKKTLVSYHEHNKRECGPQLVSRILAGETCALVTDAGTPGISDPGEDLVRLCSENGILVTAVPGPCAAITALAVSGLPTGRFTFEGFLSVQKKTRREQLELLQDELRTMIFYEAPHRLRATLQDFKEVFGGKRRIAMCRELTKLHENIMRVTIEQATEYYEINDPRGEYVLIVEGATVDESIPSMEDCLSEVARLRQEGNSLKDSVRQVSREYGVARNALYDAAVKRKSE